MILTQLRTMFVFVFLVFIATGRAESFSQSRHAVEGLVQNSACRLTECRVVGQTKVRLGGPSTWARLYSAMACSVAPLSSLIQAEGRAQRKHYVVKPCERVVSICLLRVRFDVGLNVLSQALDGCVGRHGEFCESDGRVKIQQNGA